MKTVYQLPRDRVAAITPAQLEEYILARGWKLDPASSRTNAHVYRMPGIPQAELLLPLRPDFIDYPLRVGEVLHNLAAVEDRTIWEVFLEFSDFPKPANRNGNTNPNGATKSANGARKPRRGKKRSRAAAQKSKSAGKK